MALKKSTVENFFKISQQHANAQKNSSLNVQDNIVLENNPTQTSHKLNINSTHNPTQTKHKPHTNPTQKSDRKKELTHKPYTQPNTQPSTNLTQTSHKPHTNRASICSFASIGGVIKKVLLYIYNQCKFNGTLEIIIHICDIANIAQIRIGSINTTITRLEKKGCITRLESQGGRCGWKRIKINEQTYQEILFSETQHKPNTNPTQTQHKPNTQPNTQPNTNASSSSSFNNYLNTTTSEGKNGGVMCLDEEWSKIDFEPLANVGFTETHLKQIASQNSLVPDVVQDSIFAFAFDLENNGKAKSIKGQPLNFFMGILRKGMPYAPPDNYESPKDRLMRLYAEKMKKVAKEREEVQKEAEALAFSEWFYKLTDDEVKRLLPGNINLTAADRAIKDSPMARGVARNYFKENVWSDLKKSIEDAKQPEEEI